MKKRIAILSGILALFMIALVACSTATTTQSVRWEENESYTFNISRADYNPAGSGEFMPYPCNDKTYYRDNYISATELTSATNADQLRPENVKGTYTFEISRMPQSQTKLATKQVAYMQYKTENLAQLNCLEKLSKYNVSTSDENPFTENEGLTTLRTETTTEVIFSSDEKQIPSSSMTEVKGYYLGRKSQEISEYKLETVYDFDKRTATITRDNAEEPEVVKLGVSKGATCIDANQILLYLRSYRKTTDDFKNTPSVSVYNPVTKTLATASFSINREQNVVLNNNGDKFYTTINAVAVTIGGTPFMMQYNLPDRLASKNLDVADAISAGGTVPSKYTTVRFRVGFLSYELNEYNQEILTALNAAE